VWQVWRSEKNHDFHHEIVSVTVKNPAIIVITMDVVTTKGKIESKMRNRGIFCHF
jgi:hypothetical protein